MGTRAAGALIGIALAVLLGLAWWVVELRPDAPEPSASIESLTMSSNPEPSALADSQEPVAQIPAVRPSLDESIVLSGSLRDTFGDAVDATAEDPGEFYVLSHHSRVLRASFPAVGEYRVEGLVPGAWNLEVDIRGYEPLSFPLSLLPEDRERRFDIVLRRCPRLRVIIETDIDVGDPTWFHLFGSIRPVVDKDCEPEWDLDTGSDDSGAEETDRSRRVDRYTVVLHCDLPTNVSLVFGDRILDTKEAGEDGQEVRFVVTRKDLDSRIGHLRFTVLDSRGQAPSVPGQYFLRRSERDDSTEEGWFRPGPTVCRVHPGPVILEIRLREHASRRFDLEIEPGADLDLGEIVLEPELTIRGRLASRDDELMDMANGRLDCISLSGDWRSALLVRRDDYPTTGTEGRFTLRGLGRGRYAVRARLGHLRSVAVEVSTESGSVENLQLRLMETAAVSIRHPGAPEDGCVLAIEDAAGLPVMEEWMIKGDEVRLLPGRYRARAVHRGKEIAFADFAAVLPTTRVVLEPR